MANYGQFSYTGFRAVNIRSTGGVRFEMDGVAGTLSIPPSQEAVARAWTLPDKTGRFPVMGTFAIQLPSIAATTGIQSTSVTVSGIRVEDGLTVTMNRGVSAGYGFGASTARILAAAEPTNGSITLTFYNLGVATGYVELVGTYAAVR